MVVTRCYSDLSTIFGQITYWHENDRLSVRIFVTVCLSVMLCTVLTIYHTAKVSEHVNRKCPFGTWFYNFQPLTPT